MTLGWVLKTLCLLFLVKNDSVMGFKNSASFSKTLCLLFLAENDSGVGFENSVSFVFG